MKYKQKKSTLKQMQADWKVMNLYERFEQAIALTLAVFIAIIIVLSIVRLISSTLPLLLGGVLDPMSPHTFYKLFGMIMTVLIAMEFKHSIIRVALRKDSIIQVKTVILIAQLALARKFIILNTSETGAATIAALSAGILSLGIVYWMMRNCEDKEREEEKGANNK